MRKKMKIKVVPDVNNEYTVEFDKTFSKCFGSCLSHNCCRLVILILLVLSVFFTAFVFQRLKESSDTDISCLLEKSVEIQNEQPISKIKLKPQFFGIIYFVILVLTDSVLVVLFVKDDSYIRYAKLDALLSAMESIDSFENSIDKKSTTVEEKTENSTPKTSNTTTESSNRAALLKHYMSCVTEI